MKQAENETKNLGKIVKTIPHLAVSVLLAPIVAPYEVLGVLFNASDSPVDGYVNNRLYNFLEKDKLINFWGDGFRNFGEAVRKYNSYK